MRYDAAKDALRALVEGSANLNSLSVGSLADAIHKDWPASFADILPVPRDLIGERCQASARDVHLKGLQEAIKNRPTLGCDIATAKLHYHARWLLYLGEAEHEAPPKVSIIIPIYNRGWLVDSLIENCLNQSYSAIEVVVVDDGSTDDTAARLGAFGDRIKLIRQPNSGVSAARNAAVLAATGELVHFLDSDDLLHTGHIEAKVESFAAIPDAELCYCQAMVVSLFGVKARWRFGQAFRVWENDQSRTTNLLDSMLADGYPFLVGTVTMPRHVVLRCGLFDADLCRAEDVRYWFRLALAGPKVIGLSQRLYYRCPMLDGLNEGRLVDSTPSIIVTIRNVVDLLRIPERWPAVAEYLSRSYPETQWFRMLAHEADGLGRDFTTLLETIIDLPRVGRGINRSPLPVLIFLWMLNTRSQRPEKTICWESTLVRERIGNALVTAMARAEPLGELDKNDWIRRGPKLRLKLAFAKTLSVEVTPKLSKEIGAHLNDVLTFLRDIARIADDQTQVERSQRPKVTIVVPVRADPSAAEATIASCFAQTVAERIEVIAIENNTTRESFWSERFPNIRVLTYSSAVSCGEAHAAGFALARSQHIRFLLPGDILDPCSLARQLKASKKHTDIPVVEVRGYRGELSVHPLKVSEIGPQRMFSGILFPRSVLVRVGAFDFALGDAYQARYLVRLLAADVSATFIGARPSSRYAGRVAGSVDQTDVAALANLIQCLGERRLWPQIPTVMRLLSAVGIGAVGKSELLPVKTRLLEFTLKTIGNLSENAANRSPLAAFALCLVGLEWGRASADQASRSPQFETLRSAILNGASGISLDTLGELSLTNALAEADNDPSFAKAARSVLREVHGQPLYAGLQAALRRLQKGESAGGRLRTSKVSIIERLKWKLHGPSSLSDDLELRGRLKTAASNSVAFAGFRSHTLERITELNFGAGAQYAESFLRMSPSYRKLLPEFRRNDEVGDPTTYQYPEIGRFSADTIRYVKFMSDMEVLFDSLNEFHIVEIGGGYGGQCRLIMSRFKPASYTIIDLPEMLCLASGYLKIFDLDKAVTFRKSLQRFSQQSIDLVIANYSVSEIRQSEQDRYLCDVIRQARCGYILYNAKGLRKRTERHTGEAPYELAEFAARIEGASVTTDWPLVVQHDRALGNALINWGPRRRAQY